MKTRLVTLCAAMVMLSISGCGKRQMGYYGKLDKTPYATGACNQQLRNSAEIDRHAIIDRIAVYKKRRTMYTYRRGVKIDTFRISLGKNGSKGDKIQAGDYKTPEGTYRIIRKKCDNRLYRSLLISYPDTSDIARSRGRGVSPGGYITIHGQPKWNADGRGDRYTLANDWTEGCVAVTNRAMDALWKATQNGLLIDIHP
jgi:murein L,D-transpeptidase YafK